MTSPPPTIDSLTDRELVSRYVSLRDEIAFAALVRRHSSLVLGICQRVLGHRQDVEDAFQATFLVLARDAHRVRKRESLASWLHGVAYRTSLRAAQSRHRRIRLLQDVTMIEDTTLADVELRHQRQLLDEELENLPEKYRAPLILHYLEGQTAKEVAQTLKLSTSTVEGRLKRGRKELHLRLLRRGLGLSIAVAALSATPQLVTAAEAPALVGSTIQAGLSYTAGDPAGPLFTHEAAHLAAQETLAMTLTTTTATVTALLLIPIAVTMSNHGVPSTIPQVEVASQIMTNVDEGETSTPMLLAQAEQTVEEETTDAGSGIEVRATFGNEALIGVSRSRNADQPADEESAEPQISEGRTLIRTNDGKLKIVTDNGGILIADAIEIRDRRQFWHYKRQSENEQRIEAELAGNTEFEFVDTPLSEAVDYISQLHQTTIMIDENAISGEGVTIDEPINLAVQNIKLESALDLMLEPLALDYMIKDEVMMITSHMVAEVPSDVRVYDLPEMPGAEPEKISELIMNTVDASVTWDQDGGTGTITPLEDGLVVRTSQRVHREIEALFEQLEAHSAAERAQPEAEAIRKKKSDE